MTSHDRHRMLPFNPFAQRLALASSDPSSVHFAPSPPPPMYDPTWSFGYIPNHYGAFAGTVQEEHSKHAMAEDVNSLVSNYLWGDGSFKLPKKMQEEEEFLDTVNYSNMLESGVDQNHGSNGFAPISRACYLAYHLEVLDGVLCDISSMLKQKINSARERIERLKAARGLAALPSEVLLLIFSSAIYGPPRTEPRSLSAARLSHVCRYFRKIITENPLFWTEIGTIPRKPELGIVESCLRWSKDFLLDINLNIYTTRTKVDSIPLPFPFPELYPDGVPVYRQHLLGDPVLSMVMPHRCRWKTLNLDFVYAKQFIGSAEVFEQMEGVELPMLETLTEIHHPNKKDCSDRKMSHAVSWSTPMLRTLILQHCLPHSLPSLPDITKFDIKLTRFLDIVGLFDLLAQMQSLSDFRLDTSDLDADDISSDDILTFEERLVEVLPSVKSVKFCCALDGVVAETSDEFRSLRAILAKLHLPNATEFDFVGSTASITCKRDHSSSVNSEATRISLHQLLAGFADRFPKVVNCSIVANKADNCNWHRGEITMPTQLPMEIQSLTFLCNVSTLFSTPRSKDNGISLSTLRTLTLGANPSSYYNIKPAVQWVRSIVESLQERGSWDGFEHLTILRWDGGTYEHDITIPRDGIGEWLDQGSVFPRRDGSQWYCSNYM